MMLWFTVPLVMTIVRVLQVVVLGVGPRVGRLWLVLGLGHHYSWPGAWWVALLVGWPASPVGASGDVHGEGAVGDVLAIGVSADADGEGAAGDATSVVVSGDAYSKGVADDPSGDVVGERGVGGAPGVAVADDVDGEGAAGDVAGWGAAGDAKVSVEMTLVTVPQIGVWVWVRVRVYCWRCL